jgi:hypothetical protein
MKKVLSLLFLLLFALNSVCVAEIMEDYRIACKNTDGKNLCKAVLTSDKNAEVGGFKIFPDLRIDKTIVDGKPVFKTININKSTTQNDAPVVYGDSIDLLMNSMTYEPMFMLAILPVAAMGAIASVIDDDAARWINGASKDIMDVQNEVEDFLGQALPWNW